MLKLLKVRNEKAFTRRDFIVKWSTAADFDAPSNVFNYRGNKAELPYNI